MGATPSFADRLIDAWEWTFAPQRLMQRSYEAARLKFDYKTRFSTFAAEVPMALHQARSRMRYYAENNSYFAAAHRALVTHLVGAEIVAASTHPNPATQALLNAAWARFCRECGYDGENMGGLQSALVGDWIRDGEGVAVMHTTPEGLRIQRVGADQIDDSQTRDLSVDAFVQSGIEFAGRRKVAVHMFPQAPANTSAMNLQSVRVDAADVLHVFEARGPGQVRGMPMGVSALKRGGEIDQTENALLEGVKVSALFCGIVTDENAQPSPPFGEGEQSGQTLVTPSMEPGAILHINGAGKKVHFPAPMHAAQGVEFLASQIRAVASACGLPPQFIDSDYARTNFSSLKSALAIYSSRLDQIVHTVLRPMLLDRLWRRWITVEVLAGRIEAPDFESNPDAWFGVEWFPPSPPVADDEKAAKADVLQIAHGLKSRGQAIRERGYAPEQLDAEIAAERERATTLGLSFAAPGQGQTSNEDDDDESGEPPNKS